jgi:hypothetical protein
MIPPNGLVVKWFGNKIAKRKSLHPEVLYKALQASTG